jgi:hypothetical protein
MVRRQKAPKIPLSDKHCRLRHQPSAESERNFQEVTEALKELLGVLLNVVMQIVDLCNRFLDAFVIVDLVQVIDFIFDLSKRCLRNERAETRNSQLPQNHPSRRWEFRFFSIQTR